mgnify:CR=1 FL=1|tara:strand:- start:307 stop:435 length:129 start_codon:yes stop_codon:yes gene_type:complete
MKRYDRHERAVERKLDEIIELLKMQVKITSGLAFVEMVSDEE